MNERLTHLAERIVQDLADLDVVVKRTEEAWRRARETGDDHYLDSVALNLHGFYSGVERILELIASSIDGRLPRGENWHRVLLDQVAAEVSGLRPAVISSLTAERLEEYRGFRHVVRNVYTFRFDPDRMEKLVERLPAVFAPVRAELQAFSRFLLKAGM